MRHLTLALALGIPLFALAGPEPAEPNGGRPGDPQAPAQDDRALPFYESHAPIGTYLMGLDVSARRQGNGKIYFNSLRPIYGTADGGDTVPGKPFMGNTNPGNHSVLVAKNGYAVGAVVYHQNQQGTVIDGIRVVFDRVAGDRLDPSDSYPSPWVGYQGKVVSDSRGLPVVGVRAAVGALLHTIELTTERSGDGGGKGNADAAQPPAYREPDVARAPFAANQLNLPAQERAKLATALADYAGAHEVSSMTPKLLGVALAIDPENRAAVLQNAEFKRQGGKATTRPATIPAGDPVPDLLEAAKGCKGSDAPADAALAACLYDLTLTLQPKQEDALYESELLRHQGHPPDWAWATGTSTETDATKVATEEKAFAKRQVTMKGLAIVSDPAGQQFGRVLEIILTVSPQPLPQGTPPRRAVEFAGGKVGADMRTALDEAVRTVQFRYPKWEPKRVVVSFDDKYTPKDGGSAGTAFALGLLSTLEGWDVDPKFAVTGDITVDGKVRGVGGVDAKVRGAATDGCEIVSVPADNAERIGDYLVLDGPKALADVQIFASATLADAADLARATTRPEKLQRAIDLFAEFQSSYRSSPTTATLTSNETKDKLQNVLELAPNHLSAKYLLMCAEGKPPRRLSVGMSLYRMALATNQFADSLNSARKLKMSHMPDVAFTEARTRLRALRAMAAVETVPTLQALQDFIETLYRFNRHAASEAEVDWRFSAWQAAINKLSGNPDTMAKLLREGI